MGVKEKMRVKNAFILFILIILLLSSCTNTYDDFESKFMADYYKVIENVYSPKVNDILYKLQSEENNKILQDIHQLLQDNKDLEKTNKNKYNNLKNLYEGLIQLKSAYNNWDDLDLDRQLCLNGYLNDIYFYISQSDYYKK